MTNFATGQVVYDIKGNAAEYMEKVPYGHVVLPYSTHGWPDDDYDEAKQEVWVQVYERPPIPKAWLAFVAVAVAIVVLAAVSLA